MKHVYYATSNEAKFADAKKTLTTLNPELTVEPLCIDIPESQSDNHDEIIKQKVDFVREETSRPFIVDDTSFYTERYPDFPGAYAKFTNDSLGLEGWKRLFDEGDKIRAVARIALHYFGETNYFEGEIEGSLQFSEGSGIDGFTLNDHIVLNDGQLLQDALKDPAFINHRRQALLALSYSLSTTSAQSTTKKVEIGKVIVTHESFVRIFFKVRNGLFFIDGNGARFTEIDDGLSVFFVTLRKVGVNKFRF